MADCAAGNRQFNEPFAVHTVKIFVHSAAATESATAVALLVLATPATRVAIDRLPTDFLFIALQSFDSGLFGTIVLAFRPPRVLREASH